jgi:hypothetical protein
MPRATTRREPAGPLPERTTERSPKVPHSALRAPSRPRRQPRQHGVPGSNRAVGRCPGCWPDTPFSQTQEPKSEGCAERTLVVFPTAYRAVGCEGQSISVLDARVRSGIGPDEPWSVGEPRLRPALRLASSPGARCC